MMLRRAFLWWQFAAVVVLPVAVFLARGVFGARLGWDVLASVIAAPVLGAALLIVAVLVLIRPSVLSTRAVSWFDVAVIGAWHAAVVWLCASPSALAVVAIAVLAITAFWGAVWQLFADTTRRVSGAVRDFTVEFNAAASERRRGGPIDLGELRPIDGGPSGRDGAGQRRSVAE